MKLLVTGAGGFVGSRVVQQALLAGHTVTGVIRSKAKAPPIESLGATPFVGDLEQPEALAEQAKKADAVLHLAFLHDFTRRDQALQQDINFSNAINNALKDSGKAFIAASAIGAAGPNSQPWKESDPIDTTAGRGKTESATLKGAEQGVRSIVLRLPMHVYGHKGAAFANTQAGIAKKRGVAAYTGDGGNLVTNAHVDDVAAAFLLALEHGQAGEVYSIASGEASGRDIAQAVAKKEGVETESLTPAQSMEAFGPFLGKYFSMNCTVDTSKARQRLHWQPQHTDDFLHEISL